MIINNTAPAINNGELIPAGIQFKEAVIRKRPYETKQNTDSDFSKTEQRKEYGD